MGIPRCEVVVHACLCVCWWPMQLQQVSFKGEARVYFAPDGKYWLQSFQLLSLCFFQA